MSTLGKVFVMQLPNTCIMADGDELGNGGMWLAEALGRFYLANKNVLAAAEETDVRSAARKLSQTFSRPDHVLDSQTQRTGTLLKIFM